MIEEGKSDIIIYAMHADTQLSIKRPHCQADGQECPSSLHTLYARIRFAGLNWYSGGLNITECANKCKPPLMSTAWMYIVDWTRLSLTGTCALITYLMQQRLQTMRPAPIKQCLVQCEFGVAAYRMELLVESAFVLWQRSRTHRFDAKGNKLFLLDCPGSLSGETLLHRLHQTDIH